MRDHRREQRQRRVPAQLLRQHEIGEPQGKNLGVDVATVVEEFIAAALARAAAASGLFGVRHDSRKARRALRNRVAGSSRRSAAALSARIEPHAARREEAPQAMQAPGRAGAAAGEMLGVA